MSRMVPKSRKPRLLTDARLLAGMENLNYLQTREMYRDLID